MSDEGGSLSEEGERSEESEVWAELSQVLADPPVMRPRCHQCGRPGAACWCGALPRHALRPRGRVTILQHPAERRRALQTARALQLSLAPGRCLVYTGKRFPTPQHDSGATLPPLRGLLASPRAVLLYPAPHAEDLHQVARELSPDEDYELILVDGTWPQAKAMYASSAALRAVRIAKLPPSLNGSDYIIRTQPARGCLSTLEAAADALAVLEGAPEYRSELRAPLQALCSHQLSCGAVPHQEAPHKRIGRRLKNILGDAPDHVASVT